MADLTGICAEEELLSAFLDGELHDGEVAVMARHLDGCEECRVTFARLKEVRSALRTLPEMPLPPDLLGALDHPGEELTAFLDGELTPAQVDEVVEHLSRCTACRDELQEQDAARTAVRSLPRLEIPAALLEGDGVTGDEQAPRRGWRVPVAAVVAAVVAAGAIVVGLSGDGGATIERDRLTEWHNARLTVGKGSSVIPVSMPGKESES